MSFPFCAQSRPATFRPAARTLLAVCCASCAFALLSGCDASGAKNKELDQALAAAIRDFQSATVSHIAFADAKSHPDKAYNAPTLGGKAWPDVSVAASRQDQYGDVAASLQKITENALATPVQKNIAWSLLADIHGANARLSARRADAARVILDTQITRLHGQLGEIESKSLIRNNNATQMQSIIPLIEQGDPGKSMGLGDLSKARAGMEAQLQKVKDRVAAVSEAKKSAQAQSDALYGKMSDLQLAVRRTSGKESFDLMDQASSARCESEKLEAQAASMDQELALLARDSDLRTSELAAISTTIGILEERLDAASKVLENATTDAATADAAILKLHDTWVASAKDFSEKQTAQVDARFAEALAQVAEAQKALDKAGAPGSGPSDKAAQAVCKAGLAADAARYHTLRLQAIRNHKLLLAFLAQREQVWLPGKTDVFFAQRAEALTKDGAAVADAALPCCKNASGLIGEAIEANSGEDTKKSLEAMLANVAKDQKNAQNALRELNGEAPVVEAPAAPAEPKAEEKPAEPKPEDK